MSIKAMTWVWDNAEYGGSELLLLLAIADHCNDDGECFPGVNRLAKKTRLSHSHTQTLIRKLKDIGEISVLIQQGIETGRGQTNVYHLNGYRKSIGRDIVDSTPTVRGGIVGNTRRDIVDSTPEVLQTIPKSLVEPSEKSSEKDSAQGAIILPPLDSHDEQSNGYHDEILPDKPSRKGKQTNTIADSSESDPTNQQARQLIFTYQSYAKSKDRSLHGKGLASAKELIKAGITLDNVRDWFHEKAQTAWIREKLNGVPTWNMLTAEIVSWRDLQQQPVTPATTLDDGWDSYGE